METGTPLSAEAEITRRHFPEAFRADPAVTQAEIEGSVAEARALPVLPPPTPVTELPLPKGATHWGTDREKMAETEKKMLEAANATPPIVKEALSPRDLKVAGKAFHLYTVQTQINLEALGSPLLPGAKKNEGTTSMLDVARTLWAMIEEDGVVERAIAAGPDEVRSHVTNFASAIPMADLGVLGDGIGAQIARTFAPMAQLDPPKQEGGGAPLSVPSSATAPAGS